MSDPQIGYIRRDLEESGGLNTSLTFYGLRKANLARLVRFPGHGEGDEPWSANDWAVAVTGELGELCNMLKKRRRGSAYPGMHMPTDEEIAGELADVQTYLDLLAAYLRGDLAEATVRTFNKVSERWGLPDRL
jgi:NTP pyrophosphatase (non-canonical NTP hydrolase)